MMDYEGGDLLLAGAACAGCWVTAQACDCRLCGDLNTAWRSVSVMKCALEVSSQRRSKSVWLFLDYKFFVSST